MSESLVNSEAGILRHYQVPSGAYDELGRGSIPSHWQSVVDYFESQSELSPRLQPEQIRAEMLVRDVDVARPWRLDPLPFTLSLDDWQTIERGLLQRAALLNAIVADLYGPGQLSGPGGLPPALLFGNPSFLLPAASQRTSNATPLKIMAFDIARSADGQWRVLADWTEAPEGLGMCLENRVVSRQALPELFNQLSIQRLADFFSAFAYHLRALNEALRPDSITVLMSTSPDHPNYFEHTYLGQYFGFPVVEGADLTVRGNGLALKTLEGLKPVGTVLRMPWSEDCDHLYLKQGSPYGVAGLTRLAQSGAVILANALGAGVVENDAFMSFLPGLSETFTGEALDLPSLASWWCGQGDALAFVKSHNNLSIGPAFERPRYIDTDIATYRYSSPLPFDLDNEPFRHVGRETIEPSYAPYLNEQGQWSAGPITLRLFVGATESGYHLMPGGIGRIHTPDGELTKDIWVARSAARSIPIPADATAVSARRSDRDLPSRTADDLFWLGRYLERCEGAVRAYRCLFSHIAEGVLEEQQQTISTIVDLLVALDMVSPSQAKQITDPSRSASLAWDWRAMLFDSGNSDGLVRLLQHINRLAHQVRERLSGDTWRMFNALAQVTQDRWRLVSINDALGLMDEVIERLSSLNGQIQENMTRGYGWRLLELGRRLERCQFGLQVVGEIVATPSYSTTQMYLLLDLCDSIITYRSRYQNMPVLENLLHLVMLDEANPRSMVHQVNRMRQLMSEMPLDQEGDELSDSQRLLLSAYHELILAEPTRLTNVISRAGNRTELRRVIQRLERTLARLSELVTATYFAHSLDTGRS